MSEPSRSVFFTRFLWLKENKPGTEKTGAIAKCQIRKNSPGELRSEAKWTFDIFMVNGSELWLCLLSWTFRDHVTPIWLLGPDTLILVPLSTGMTSSLPTLFSNFYHLTSPLCSKVSVSLFNAMLSPQHVSITGYSCSLQTCIYTDDPFPELIYVCLYSSDLYQWLCLPAWFCTHKCINKCIHEGHGENIIFQRNGIIWNFKFLQHVNILTSFSWPYLIFFFI